MRRAWPVTAVRRPRDVYRGWWIVLTCYCSQTIATGASGWVFGVLLEPMGNDLGWSRAQLVGAITVASLAGGLLAARLGPVVDHHGPRVLMTVSALGGGLALVALLLVQSTWQYYLVWGVFGLATPGLGLLAPRAAIANWFVRRRAIAFMIFTFGSTTAGIVVAPVMAWVASGWGWRAAWALMGLLACALAPLAWATLRRRPEDLGLLPDGDSPAEPAPPTTSTQPVVSDTAARAVSVDGPALVDEPNWTTGQALRTRAFWLLTLGFMLISLPASAIFVHIAPYALSKGFSYEAAATVVSAYGVGTLIGRGMWGLAIARLRIYRSLVLFGFVYGTGILIFMLPQTLLQMWLATVLLGVSIAGLQQLQAQSFPDYYGRRIVGALMGYSGLTYTVARAGAPLYAAFLYDFSGNYTFAFASFVVASYLSAIVFLLAGPPTEPPSATPAGVGVPGTALGARSTA